MPNGTRSTWMAALLALALGAGQLVAYQGVAPHAQQLLTRGHGGAALAAVRIVARDLGALVAGRAQAAVGDLALIGVRETSRLYRLAEHALGVADPAAAPSGCSGADPEADAAFASEPDMPCVTPGPCAASRGAAACPPCPLCPGRPARAAAPAPPATPSRSGA